MQFISQRFLLSRRRYVAIALLLLPAIAAAQSKSAPLREALAWQIALEKIGFSPGVIDGSIGRKTYAATTQFQRVRGLPMTGRLDPATSALLNVGLDSATMPYRVQQEDMDSVGPLPKKWEEKSRLKYLGYESIDASIAERFHCSRGLLKRLNPSRNLARLRTGDEIIVPNVQATGQPQRPCNHIEIDVGEKTVRVFDRDQKLAAFFHCSIAKDFEKVPWGETRVGVVSKHPTYLFDPRMWPEVKDVKKKLLIPKGPRNPVGLCWIGLNLPGYGIHGSPAPELIGKTGSHGCFRLTNWDALRLGEMVRVGATVKFTGHTQLAAARPAPPVPKRS